MSSLLQNGDQLALCSQLIMAIALVLALVATFVAQNAVTALMTSTPSAKPPNCRGKSSAPWSKCVKAATAAPRSTSEPDRRWDDLIRLRLPKLKKAKPLEASLERPSHDVPVVLFAVVTVVLFAWLLAMATGALPTVRLSPGYNWLIIPLPLAYVLLAATGLGPWVGAAPSAAGTDTATMDVVSFGIFSGLVIQGTAFVVMGKLGPHSHLTRVMYAPCAIYVMALSYYATKVIGTPLVATDAFGLRHAAAVDVRGEGVPGIWVLTVLTISLAKHQSAYPCGQPPVGWFSGGVGLA